MEDLATIRRIKLEQCVQLATFQTDATQVGKSYKEFLNLQINEHETYFISKVRKYDFNMEFLCL